MIKLKILLKNKLFRNFLIYLTSGGIAKAIPFLVLIVIANYLSKEDYGIISNFFVVTGLFTSLINMRLSEIFQSDYYKDTTEVRNVKLSNIIYIKISVAIFCLLLVIVLKDRIYEFTQIEFFWIIIAVFISFLNSFSELRSALLRLEENPKRFAFFQMINTFLTGALSILFVAILLLSWQGRIYSTIITSVVMFFISFRYIALKYNFPKKFSSKDFKEYFSLGLPLVPQSLAPFLRKGMDKILITKSISLGANGIYSLAISITTVCDMFVDSLFATYIPSLYQRLVKIKDEKEKKQIVKNNYKIMLIVGFALIALNFLFIVLVKYFLREDYQDAINYIPFLIINTYLYALYKIFSAYVIFEKKTTYLGTSIFLVALFHVTSSIIFIPIYGVYGAITIMLIASFIKLIIAIILSVRYYPLPWINF